MDNFDDSFQLSSPSAPAPFRTMRPDSSSPFLLVCDHASAEIPAAYGDLGLQQSDLQRHIAWDIGAAEVARHMSHALGATAILAGASRLLIDVNRQYDDPSLAPAVSDGVHVPGNQLLTPEERAHRIETWHKPYHREIARHIDRRSARGQATILLSIHSFTPQMGSETRPWHVGIIWTQKSQIAPDILIALGRGGDLVVGDNQPYGPIDPKGFTIHTHGEDRDLPFAGIEIRQDQIGHAAGIRHWGDRLTAIAKELV